MMRSLGMAGVMVLLAGGAAAAADPPPDPRCDQSITPSTFSGTNSFGSFVLSSGDLLTCNVQNAVKIPAGYYGVFKVDSQGFVKTVNGEKVRFTVTRDGVEKLVTVRGPKEDDVTFTRYFATGKVLADTPFEADVTVDTGDLSDVDSYGEYDVLDILAGYTTLANAQGSLTEVGREQTGLITHLDLTAGVLTGFGRPTEGADEWGVFGALGSFDLGGHVRYNLSPGLSLLGGASLVNLGTGGASASGVIGAVALRYVEPTGSTFRLYGEGGVEAGGLGLSFTRHYNNGTPSDYEAGGSGLGALGGIYVKGGALVDIDATNQLLFSASIKETGLFFGNFVEDDPTRNPNLFAADYSGHHALATTVKTGVDWTTTFRPDLDLTASLGVGATFGGAASANIFGIGEVSGNSTQTLFAEYGVRLGWSPTPSSTLDGFIQGTSGTGIGTHLQVGTGYRVKF